MYEKMATVGSLDVVNLPTISADTTMSLFRYDFPNQSKRQLGRYVMSYSCTLVDVNFYKGCKPTDQKTENQTSIAAQGS